MFRIVGKFLSGQRLVQKFIEPFHFLMIGQAQIAEGH